MPYQPISPTPYLATIDANDDNVFSCIINPRDTIVEYVLTIIDNDTGKTILTVTEDESSLTYYGVHSSIGDSAGDDDGIYYTSTISDTDSLQLPVSGSAKEDAYLEITIPAGYIMYYDADNEKYVSGSGDFVWNIKLYNSAGTSVTSSDYYFQTRAAATVTVYNNGTELEALIENNLDSYAENIDSEYDSIAVSNTITGSRINITADYEQEDGILPAYYCFTLYLDGNVVYTTGNIISSVIEFEYDGLVRENAYTLELMICDDEKRFTTLEYDLVVEYEYSSTSLNPVITVNNNDCSVEIDYSENVSIVGNCSGDTEAEILKYEALATTNSLYTGMISDSSDLTMAVAGSDDIGSFWLFSEEYSDTDSEIGSFSGGDWLLKTDEGFVIISSKDNYFNAVCIPNGESITWSRNSTGDLLNLNNTYSYMKWHGHNVFDGVIFEMSENDYSLGTVYLGHDVSETFQRSDYTEGIEYEYIEAGFYYKFGSYNKTYISEFTRVAPAYIDMSTEDYDVIDEDTLYILDDADELSDDYYLRENDPPYNYWWLVSVLQSSAIVEKLEAYNEEVG